MVCCPHRTQVPPFVQAYAPFCSPYAGGSAMLSSLYMAWDLAWRAKFGIPHQPYVCDLWSHLVSKTQSKHGQGYFWLCLVCLFPNMLWCSKGVRFVEWVESISPQSNCNVQIIYQSSNSSNDFTIAKKTPRSIKHLQKNPWSHFYITSIGFQCTFIKSNQK